MDEFVEWVQGREYYEDRIQFQREVALPDHVVLLIHEVAGGGRFPNRFALTEEVVDEISALRAAVGVAAGW